LYCEGRKKRLHLWIVKPEVIISYLNSKGWECKCEKNTISFFNSLEGGKKAKYFKWLTRHFRMPFDYAIMARSRADK
jgi:hypothetical protein